MTRAVMRSLIHVGFDLERHALVGGRELRVHFRYKSRVTESACNMGNHWGRRRLQTESPWRKLQPIRQMCPQ